MKNQRPRSERDDPVGARPVSARLLGEFRLSLDDADARPRGRKAAGLLAFLASAEAATASRTRLADLLWSDRGDDQARNSLRQAIAEIRASPVGAAGLIEVTRDTVGFVDGAFGSDIGAIRAAAGRRDAAALAHLLGRVHGGFLDDLDGLSPAFDEWLMTERTRQQDQLVALLIEAVGDMPGSAAPADLQKVLGALETMDPLNEAVTRLRLRLDHAVGDVAAVHRRFRRLADDLGRNLGIGPSQETRALFDTLLATTAARTGPSPPAPARPAAPAPPAPPLSRVPPAVLVTALVPDGQAESADLAAICTEDVRTALARNGELRVLMVDAVDPARAQAVMGTAIAAYRLAGSVRVVRGRTTVTVELGNVASGFVIWSEQLRLTESSLEQIDDIVARIVGAVAPAIERDLSGGLEDEVQAEESPREAALLYLRGRQFVREARTLEAIHRGVDLLEAVIRLDPRHVSARMRLSQLYNTDYSFLLAGHDVAAFRTRARLLIEEAAALEPGNVRVQLRLAWCHLRQREWHAADRLFRAASAAMPHDADALNECGFGLACMGELERAEALMQRAFQLNPFAPIEYHADHAVLLALAGDAQASEEHFAVCAEQRLFYLAVRLGNLTRLQADPNQQYRLQQRFIDAFMAIWQPPTPPAHADLVAWLDYSLCLRRAEHRQLVLGGIEAAWLTRPQATRDRIP